MSFIIARLTYVTSVARGAGITHIFLTITVPIIVIPFVPISVTQSIFYVVRIAGSSLTIWSIDAITILTAFTSSSVGSDVIFISLILRTAGTATAATAAGTASADRLSRTAGTAAAAAAAGANTIVAITIKVFNDADTASAPRTI